MAHKGSLSQAVPIRRYKNLRPEAMTVRRGRWVLKLVTRRKGSTTEKLLMVWKERKRRGIAGKGGKDVSHTKSGKLVLENSTKNRGRNGKNGKSTKSESR